MKQILIIEDEVFLRKNIKELLQKHGYNVMDAASKAEAMQYILHKQSVDLYLVDVWLPDGDGFEICEQIRLNGTAPVLFLTACDDEDSIVKGLQIGGDDYISKPFRSAELLSRIEANLRRVTMERQQRQIIRCGEIVLDVTQERAFKNGEDLGLGLIEYQLLEVLMRHEGRIVKRELLLGQIWDSSGKFVQDNTLSVSVRRLRNKVGQEYIETVHGYGYRFVKPEI